MVQANQHGDHNGVVRPRGSLTKREEILVSATPPNLFVVALDVTGLATATALTIEAHLGVGNQSLAIWFVILQADDVGVCGEDFANVVSERVPCLIGDNAVRSFPVVCVAHSV